MAILRVADTLKKTLEELQCIISMEFLHSLLRCHFAGKPSQNVAFSQAIAGRETVLLESKLNLRLE